MSRHRKPLPPTPPRSATSRRPPPPSENKPGYLRILDRLIVWSCSSSHIPWHTARHGTARHKTPTPAPPPPQQKCGPRCFARTHRSARAGPLPDYPSPNHQGRPSVRKDADSFSFFPLQATGIMDGAPLAHYPRRLAGNQRRLVNNLSHLLCRVAQVQFLGGDARRCPSNARGSWGDVGYEGHAGVVYQSSKHGGPEPGPLPVTRGGVQLEPDCLTVGQRGAGDTSAWECARACPPALYAVCPWEPGYLRGCGGGLVSVAIHNRSNHTNTCRQTASRFGSMWGSMGGSVGAQPLSGCSGGSGTG